jgi:zinc/manganese transport system substrate-binding protein
VALEKGVTGPLRARLGAARLWAAGTLALGVFGSGFLSACGSSLSGSAGSESAVSVVASTNVYGDIARQIAGDRQVAEHKVSITSIIDRPGADPHSFEADTRNQLALSRADIVVENGGGYDDFVDAMLRAKNSEPKVLNVVRISGRSGAAGAGLNEHLWYDLPTVARLADQLVATLSAADPADAPTFATNARIFTLKLEQLEVTEASIRSEHAGLGVAITEPVPLYLLEACGFTNKTPDRFSAAIEEGSDVPAAVLRQTLDLFGHQQVRLLVYNEQTAGPETQRMLAAARVNNIPAVAVTETLPDGKDYLAWMSENLSAIQAALR